MAGWFVLQVSAPQVGGMGAGEGDHTPDCPGQPPFTPATPVQL